MDHVQYNLLFTVKSAPNFILPIIIGNISDKFGVRITLVFMTIIIFIGVLIQTYAVYINSYNLLLLGMFILGLGDCLCILVGIIITKWFYGKNLGFSIAFPLTVWRVGTISSTVIYPAVY